MKNEEKKAVERLREAELRYHTLFEQSPDGILLIDTEGNLLEFNRAAHLQLGYSREELAKLSISDIDPFQTPEQIRASIKEVLKAGRAEFEVKHRRKDGEIRNIQVITQVMELSGRRVFHTIWRDVTEHKRAVEELRKSEEQYRLLFSSNPHPMWVYDLETLSFLAVNEATVQHYGYSLEEFFRMAIKEIWYPEDVPLLLDNLSVAPINVAGLWRHRKKDGTVIYVEVAASSLTFAGRDAGLVSANDVAERKKSAD